MTPRRNSLNRAENYLAKALSDAQARSTDVARRMDRLVNRSTDEFLQVPEVEALILAIHASVTRSFCALRSGKSFEASMVGLIASIRMSQLEEIEVERAAAHALRIFSLEGGA